MMVDHRYFWLTGLCLLFLTLDACKKQIAMNFSIQPVLENEYVKLLPLEESDFEALYAVAADPKIWEQHPNRDRWKKEVFRTYFDGAIESQGAFKIVDKATGEIAGSTRYYDYKADERSILIGYTFYATKYWGKGVNPSVKQLMLSYIFQFVDRVFFHVGANNIRSQMAMERIGGRRVGEVEVAYYGEPAKTNVVYEITAPE